MTFYVAMSCLQGRPMQAAFDDLARLACGIQLTPGNLPTPAFAAHVAARTAITPTRRHHGFAYALRKAPAVWSDGGACMVASESVHPPLADEPAAAGWEAWYAETSRAKRPIVEVMYPSYTLGDGAAIERAIDAGWDLAVDTSHAFIQITQGAMTPAQWQRLCDYDRVAEVHVSANRGEFDSHQPVAADTFGLAWARARLAAGTPVVLECYMHKLAIDERRRQVDLVREAA
jgi:hypothetical protein